KQWVGGLANDGRSRARLKPWRWIAVLPVVPGLETRSAKKHRTAHQPGRKRLRARRQAPHGRIELFPASSATTSATVSATKWIPCSRSTERPTPIRRGPWPNRDTTQAYRKLTNRGCARYLVTLVYSAGWPSRGFLADSDLALFNQAIYDCPDEIAVLRSY